MLEKALEGIYGAMLTSPLVATFVYLWWSERDERRKVQGEKDELAKRLESGLSDATTAVRTIAAGQQATQTLLATMKDLFILRQNMMPAARPRKAKP